MGKLSKQPILSGKKCSYFKEIIVKVEAYFLELDNLYTVIEKMVGRLREVYISIAYFWNHPRKF